MSTKKIGFFLTLAVSMLFSNHLYAQDDHNRWIVGFQGGIQSIKRNDENFEQYDLFAYYRLPWRWMEGENWNLDTELGGTLGRLRGGGDSAAIGSLALGLVWNRKNSGWALRIGAGPSYMSKQRYGVEDFGSQLQFISYAGLSYRFPQNWTLSYRFQHMSNAGIKDPNPGLNFQMLGLAYSF